MASRGKGEFSGPPLQGLLDRAARRVRSELVERMTRAGYPEIRPAHSPVFAFLPREGARLTVLAEAAGMTKQAMGELIKDLAGNGLVTTRPDPRDKRAKLIAFTPKGLAAARTGRRTYAAIDAEIEQRLGRTKFATLRDALIAIAEDL